METLVTERKISPAAEPPVVSADLAPPAPPRPLIARPRLYDLLDEGIARPVTLVSAQAGAGKTVLLGSWLSERDPAEQVAWLSLRPDHSEPEFWAALLETVRRATRSRGVAALAAPKGQASKAFLNSFLNALAALDAPLLVVIDDLHQAPAPVVSSALRHVLWGRVPQ